jgi:hypothetical protein
MHKLTHATVLVTIQHKEIFKNLQKKLDKVLL